jgi:hypothetical protein
MSEIKNIQSALIAIMRDCEAIGKNKRNTMQNYNFRGIDDVANELHEHFAKHGVFVLPEVLTINQVERITKAGGAVFYTTITCKFTFMAPDGSSVSCVAAGEGMDSGDKSTNKAMSAALKYSLLQVFLIPTEEKKDSEEDSHEIKPQGNANGPAKGTAPPKGNNAPTPPQNEPQANSKKVVPMTEQEFTDLQAEVKAARDEEELKGVWEKYPKWHTHTAFNRLVKDHKKYLVEYFKNLQTA